MKKVSSATVSGASSPDNQKPITKNPQPKTHNHTMKLLGVTLKPRSVAPFFVPNFANAK